MIGIGALASAWAFRLDPHPNPPPEYRERGPEAAQKLRDLTLLTKFYTFGKCEFQWF
jgi:hypothetical protein